MVENGTQSRGINLTDINCENAENGTGNLSEENHNVKGPWTHSTDSYSRKLRITNSIGHEIPKKAYCIVGTISVVVFIVGLALGIIIGAFAIGICVEDKSSQSGGSSAQMFTSAMQTTVVTTRSTSTPCICTTETTRATPTVSKPECNVCDTRNPDESTGNESLSSPFAPLTYDEIDKAMSVMRLYGNVTAGQRFTDNRISHVYLYPNKKTEVLEFLDKNGKFPGRFAKVHVFRGAVDPPDVMEYKVGPLDLSNDKMLIKKLREDGEINFNRRPYDKTETAALIMLVRPHLWAIDNLLSESFDGAKYMNGIRANFAFMPTYNESDRLSTMFLSLQMGGFSTIRVLPVTCKAHHPGTDSSKWRVFDFYYLSQGPFGSGKELQEAFDLGNLRKVVFPTSYITSHYNEFDLKVNTSLPVRPNSDIPPPRTYEPEGPRYTIKGNRVSWMDWEFEFSSHAITGPALFDVRFKNERVAYEISLQDVTLIYSSQSNGAGPPILSDTLFYLGNSNPPHLNLDCPDRARRLSLSMFVYGSIANKPYACVFEADGQEAAWKFNSLGMSSHYLVVRAPMNLGNYEYSVEWRFHLDGHLETLMSASGYLYGAFWDQGDPLVDVDKSSTPFGYRLADYMLGPIHDHAYAFKVDVDVLGVNNSMEILHWKTGDVLSALKTQTNASEVPGFFPFNNTRYIKYELVDREGGFVLDPLNPRYFTIVNENERNFWGVKRGYRVIPHSQGAENFEDHVMFNAWEHLKYNMAVTRRKDSEAHATESLYDLFQPLSAFKGVGNMLDNETIRNEDLVLWVTEKFYHAPSAEDLPMTLKVNRGFTLKPYNYFDRTPTFDIPGYYQNTPSDPYSIDSCYLTKP